MADQHLLTIFIAITAVAILIQTGITAGLCFVSFKMSRQAERAAAEAKRYVEPAQRLINQLESAANRLAEFTAESKTQLHEMEFKFERGVDRLRRKVG